MLFVAKLVLLAQVVWERILLDSRQENEQAVTVVDEDRPLYC
jgi:hypothetical protein